MSRHADNGADGGVFDPDSGENKQKIDWRDGPSRRAISAKSLPFKRAAFDALERTRRGDEFNFDDAEYRAREKELIDYRIGQIMNAYHAKPKPDVFSNRLSRNTETWVEHAFETNNKRHVTCYKLPDSHRDLIELKETFGDCSVKRCMQFLLDYWREYHKEIAMRATGRPVDGEESDMSVHLQYICETDFSDINSAGQHLEKYVFQTKRDDLKKHMKIADHKGADRGLFLADIDISLCIPQFTRQGIDQECFGWSHLLESVNQMARLCDKESPMCHILIEILVKDEAGRVTGTHIITMSEWSKESFYGIESCINTDNFDFQQYDASIAANMVDRTIPSTNPNSTHMKKFTFSMPIEEDDVYKEMAETIHRSESEEFIPTITDVQWISFEGMSAMMAITEERNYLLFYMYTALGIDVKKIGDRINYIKNKPEYEARAAERHARQVNRRVEKERIKNNGGYYPDLPALRACFNATEQKKKHANRKFKTHVFYVNYVLTNARHFLVIKNISPGMWTKLNQMRVFFEAYVSHMFGGMSFFEYRAGLPPSPTEVREINGRKVRLYTQARVYPFQTWLFHVADRDTLQRWKNCWMYFLNKDYRGRYQQVDSSLKPLPTSQQQQGLHVPVTQPYDDPGLGRWSDRAIPRVDPAHVRPAHPPRKREDFDPRNRVTPDPHPPTFPERVPVIIPVFTETENRELARYEKSVDREKTLSKYKVQTVIIRDFIKETTDYDDSNPREALHLMAFCRRILGYAKGNGPDRKQVLRLLNGLTAKYRRSKDIPADARLPFDSEDESGARKTLMGYLEAYETFYSTTGGRDWFKFNWNSRGADISWDETKGDPLMSMTLDTFREVVFENCKERLNKKGYVDGKEEALSEFDDFMLKRTSFYPELFKIYTEDVQDTGVRDVEKTRKRTDKFTDQYVRLFKQMVDKIKDGAIIHRLDELYKQYLHSDEYTLDPDHYGYTPEYTYEYGDRLCNFMEFTIFAFIRISRLSEA